MNPLTILCFYGHMEHLIFVMQEFICDVKFLVQWFITSDQSEQNFFIKIIISTFRSEYFL